MTDQPYDQMNDTDPERPLYPEAVAHLSGEDGNAYAILARVRTALRRADVPKDETERFQREATSGDYDHLLQTAMRWVTVR